MTDEKLDELERLGQKDGLSPASSDALIAEVRRLREESRVARSNVAIRESQRDALRAEVERLREVDGDNSEAYADLEAERDAVRDRLRRVILASRGCVEQVILRGSLPADVELRARNTLREIEAASVPVLSDTSRSGGTRDAVEKLVAERDEARRKEQK